MGTLSFQHERLDMSAERHVHVISDLHLGGAPADASAVDEGRRRGFRMMTHPASLAAFVASLASKPVGRPEIELVINGDFVDFLAEEHDTQPPWVPFLFDRGLAVDTFATISSRTGPGGDAQVFDALRTFVLKGHRLTLLLGNHDLELGLPEVREAFLSRIGASRVGDVRFLYDGEAYAVGDAMIEHGNQYDAPNFVDHDGFRRARERRSRGFFELQAKHFAPPPGTELVCSVMNPIKSRYAFIDLLKPESEPLFALLLALEPDAASELGRVATVLARARTQFFPKVSAMKSPVRGTRATPTVSLTPPTDEISALRTLLAEATSHAANTELLALLEQTSAPARATRGGATRGGRQWLIDRRNWLAGKLSLLTLLAEGRDSPVDRRLRAVHQALCVLDNDQTWDMGQEPDTTYRRAALELTRTERSSFKYVVFGHTHHAKNVSLKETGGTYLNTGTWANLMRFPAQARSPDVETALPALRELFDAVRANRLERYIEFSPTYALLEVVDGRVRSAGIHAWKSPAAG